MINRIKVSTSKMWFKWTHPSKYVQITWFITSKQTEPEAKSILGWYILFMNPMLKKRWLQLASYTVVKWQNWSRDWIKMVYKCYLGDLKGYLSGSSTLILQTPVSYGVSFGPKNFTTNSFSESPTSVTLKNPVILVQKVL